MPLKRYEITLVYTLDVDELSDEVVTESIKGISNYEELLEDADFWEDIKMQRLLLAALLENPQALSRFVQHQAYGLIETEGLDFLREWEEDERDILSPVVDKLADPEVRAHFREAIEHPVFFELSEQFTEAFKLGLAKAEIQEVATD